MGMRDIGVIRDGVLVLVACMALIMLLIPFLAFAALLASVFGVL